MILSDKTILKRLKDQELIIDPFSTSQLQSASVDLRLANHFLTVDENAVPLITIDKPADYKEFRKDIIIMPPQSFLLGSTLELYQLT
ncbi:hypothetical protein [Bacillus sp. OV166]|uniref:dCTP deaminase n=1 Tax=Bacillus sp. OV166 TaxID=1882763 RepID=UPI00267D9CC6|nr:hypothetical protein [Bacillus sp. OV166]